MRTECMKGKWAKSKEEGNFNLLWGFCIFKYSIRNNNISIPDFCSCQEAAHTMCWACSGDFAN